MHKTNLKARIINKKTNVLISEYDVMDLKYSVKNDILWITDHRNHIIDFDLNDVEVEIKTFGGKK